MKNVEAGAVNYASKIEGEDGMPVENVSLVNAMAAVVREAGIRNRDGERFQHEN
jgi:hypothetical protein